MGKSGRSFEVGDRCVALIWDKASQVAIAHPATVLSIDAKRLKAEVRLDVGPGSRKRTLPLAKLKPPGGPSRTNKKPKKSATEGDTNWCSKCRLSPSKTVAAGNKATCPYCGSYLDKKRKKPPGAWEIPGGLPSLGKRR